MKETRKFFCITQQLFLFLSKFPSAQTLYFAGFFAMGGKHHFLNYLAIAQIAVLNIDPVKQNKQKKNLWIWGSLLKTKSEKI